MKADRTSLEAFYQTIQQYGSKPGLEVVKALLHELGNPEKSLRIIHVVGTNGKGSSTMMLASILKEEKYKTGVFTSPSFSSVDGGIRVNGESVSDEIIVACMDEIMEACKCVDRKIGSHPTSFEVELALALVVFERIGLDFVILEAGLGGRLDATNITDVPEGVLVTQIGMDHEAFLGNSLKEIAEHKAGIIKPFTHVVSQPQKDEVSRVIMKEATDVNAKLLMIHQGAITDLALTPQGTQFSYRGKRYFTSLLGIHQSLNAASVIRLLEFLNINVREESISRGLMNVKHPGRLEILRQEPLVIMDGAHNLDSSKALASTLKRLYGDRQFALVLGVMKDKDIEGMLGELKDCTKAILPTSANHQRSMPVEELSKIISDNGIKLLTGSLEEVLASNDPIIVLGSLYIQKAIRAKI